MKRLIPVLLVISGLLMALGGTINLATSDGVRPWDVVMLIMGVAVVAIGVVMARQGRRRVSAG